MKEKILTTLVAFTVMLSLVGCSHFRAKINEAGLLDGKIVHVPVKYKQQPSASEYEKILDFHIVAESIVQDWSQEKALEDLNNQALNNGADLIVIEYARSEYAKSMLLTYRVQTELTGNFYRKKNK